MSNSRFLADKPNEVIENPVVPKIKGVRPFGGTILVEMLTKQEALGTKFHVSEGVEAGAPQAYIVAFGTKFNVEDSGLAIGDRVMLQGRYVPVPKYDNSHRQRGIVELHEVKAVLEETTSDAE